MSSYVVDPAGTRRSTQGVSARAPALTLVLTASFWERSTAVYRVRRAADVLMMLLSGFIITREIAELIIDGLPKRIRDPCGFGGDAWE
jgi:hypothetical protein